MHLSPKHTYLLQKCAAFSTKMHCILHQNALHLAPKRKVFWC